MSDGIMRVLVRAGALVAPASAQARTINLAAKGDRERLAFCAIRLDLAAIPVPGVGALLPAYLEPTAPDLNRGQNRPGRKDARPMAGVVISRRPDAPSLTSLRN